ncbi:hypothetical protein BA011_34665 (plasmid) [Rhizobium leguminosarum]|uniref:Transposase n=1 Tax=Rhizobium leguminosarum TaxID=384 RepID=A0A1B1CMX8_RHILE|nr:hypothetical protein BA011_34665 [Rhizobium leguminosarum]
MVEKSRADYWTDLDAAIEAERKLRGQKPLKDKERRPEVKKTKVSRSDPDSGYMVRDGKPNGFFSLDHRTVDGKLAIITDTYVTPAMSTTRSSISQGSTGSRPVLASMSARTGWMPAMLHRASPRTWKTGRSLASQAVAIPLRPSPS